MISRISRKSECRKLAHFHDEIADAVKARPKDAYLLFYFSGVAQPTLQSVTMQDGCFKAERSVPADFPNYRGTGDGTVPLFLVHPTGAVG